MRWLILSYLIEIYAVCKIPLFASLVLKELKNLFSSLDTEPNGFREDILRNNIQENITGNLELPITEEEMSKNKEFKFESITGTLCIDRFKATVDIIMPYLHLLFNYIYERDINPLYRWV